MYEVTWVGRRLGHAARRRVASTWRPWPVYMIACSTGQGVEHYSLDPTPQNPIVLDLGIREVNALQLSGPSYVDSCFKSCIRVYILV